MARCRWHGARLLMVWTAAAACLLLPSEGSGQYYDIGTDAASVRWNSVRSRDFEVIYSSDKSPARTNYMRAARYLDLMERFYGIQSDSIPYNYGLSRRFPLVLHTYNASSNGLTVWAPRQIDLYGVPSPDILYPARWDEQLALHEGRHAWQIAHFNRGFLKVLYWFFGDQVIGGASGIYPSRWMLEGDAVVAETEMSRSGRGRSGKFLNGILRAARSGKEIPGWDRLRFGSVKKYDMGPYALGYAVNSMARLSTGDYNLTHKILGYEAMHLTNANAIASAFEDFSGKDHRYYVGEESMRRFEELNTNRKLGTYLQSIGVRPDSREGNAAAEEAALPLRSGSQAGYYTVVSHLREVGADSVAALVSGSGSSPYLAIFTKDSGGAWRSGALRSMSSTASVFAAHGADIYWSEVKGDLRWEQKSRSRIYSYNLKDETLRALDLKGENLYKPYVADGILYAVEYTDGGERSFIRGYRMEDIERVGTGAGSGTESSILPCLTLECDGQVTELASDGKTLCYTQIESGGLAMYRVGITADGFGRESARELILGPRFSTIRELSFSPDGTLFFITDNFGGERVCRLMLPDGKSGGKIFIAAEGDDIKSYSLGFSRTGENAAESGDGRLMLRISEFDGPRGAFFRTCGILDIEIDSSYRFDWPLAEELSAQYATEIRKRSAGERGETAPLRAEYSEQLYGKGAHLFRLHSWAPAYSELSGAESGSSEDIYGEGKPGATVYTQNTLGTAAGLAGYSYERRRSADGRWRNLHAGHLKFRYSGWYPVLEAAAHYNDKEMYEPGRHSLRGYITAYVPLNFSQGGWLRGLTPRLSWRYRNDEEILEKQSDGKYRLKQIRRDQIVGTLGGYAVLPTAKAAVFPRLGAGAVVAAGFNPGGGENFGSIYSLRVYGYLPGIAFNQSLKLSAGYQYQDIGNRRYWSGNLLDLPRGYTNDIYGRHYFRASADYAVPLYLGDLSCGLFAYLKRLDIIPFCDLAFVQQFGYGDGEPAAVTERINNISSFGADMVLHAHFFRIGFPVSVGVRYARTMKERDYISPLYPGSAGKEYVGLLLGITFR